MPKKIDPPVSFAFVNNGVMELRGQDLSPVDFDRITPELGRLLGVYKVMATFDRTAEPKAIINHLNGTIKHIKTVVDDLQRLPNHVKAIVQDSGVIVDSAIDHLQLLDDALSVAKMELEPIPSSVGRNPNDRLHQLVFDVFNLIQANAPQNSPRLKIYEATGQILINNGIAGAPTDPDAVGRIIRNIEALGIPPIR